MITVYIYTSSCVFIGNTRSFSARGDHAKDQERGSEMSYSKNVVVEEKYIPSGMELLVRFLMLAPMYAWQGFVLSVVWNWFIPSQFHGAPELNVAGAIGISLLVSYMTYQNNSKTRPLWWDILTSLLSGSLILLVGWITHAFM